jgi:hypothetical protein
MRLMHSATSCNPSAAAVVRKMTSNVFSRIIAAIGDSFRITKAFDMAARGEYEKALNVLNRLGQDTRHLYGARLLRGALYSHLAMHERAVIELASAAQTIKADKRFSKAESNYLVPLHRGFDRLNDGLHFDPSRSSRRPAQLPRS